VLIEILRDPDLYRRVCAEIVAAGAVTIDESTGTTRFDGTKASSLPLLQSVFLECLRLYQTIPIVRSLRNDIEIDGYTLREGNAIITPSYLAHYNPSVWSAPQHPANAFWADRFMHNPGDPSQSGRKDLGDFFPFGGGLNICPGRHRAKEEILGTVTVLLTKFEFEFVSYVDKNGRPTAQEPGPLNIENYESRGVVQPDRDVLVRMRKVEFRKCGNSCAL
jgi:cytochrome P450